MCTIILLIPHVFGTLQVRTEAMWFRQGLLKAVAALSCTSVVNCSKLLSGGTIIAFNETTADLQVIRNGSLLLTGDRIISIFNTSSPPNLPSDIEVIDCTERIITPGFIDTHRHGWQTVYKTLGSNTTLAEYLLRYGQFVSASYFTPEDVYISQLTGIYETLAAGVTTILDHAHHTWTPEHSAAGLNASIDSGARVSLLTHFTTRRPSLVFWSRLSSGRNLLQV
jgi:cytosine/adenosine deaminase-related metal-dependent hydrolase